MTLSGQVITAEGYNLPGLGGDPRIHCVCHCTKPVKHSHCRNNRTFMFEMEQLKDVTQDI